MNREVYWILRKKVFSIVFRIKKILYRVINFISDIKENMSFRGMMIKYSVLGILKAIALTIILMCFDRVITLKIKDIPDVDNQLFLSTIIAGIGIAGVILGLYCANITSIHSARYANAPKHVSNSFQKDRLTRKCITGIVDYIIFGLIVITVSLLTIKMSWAVVIAFVYFSVKLVVSYSIAGNRTYQLADVYRLATDAHRNLYHVISKKLNHILFATDINFQNHFLKIAEEQINLLKEIQKFGENINKGKIVDNSTMVELMRSNLSLIELYWMEKESISRSSLWFRVMPKYQRWHFTGSTEASITLQTGTALKTKEEHHYWWFEEELISINKLFLNNLLEQEDFSSVYMYLNIYDKMCSTAIKYKEANYFIGHIDWIKELLEKNMVSNDMEGEERKFFAGVIESISLLYLDLILESNKAYQEFDLEKIVSKIISAIDSGEEAEKNRNIRGRQEIDFYKKIVTEIKVEYKRITPNWVIKQQIAKEEYIYLNSLLDIIREGMNQAFNLGKVLLEKNLYFEACIVLTRFYECEAKLTRFIKIAEYRKDELVSSQIDKELKWNEFRLKKLQDTMVEWKKEVPTLLHESSRQFALENWNNREEYPDFLGECYNHICEDAVDAIISSDIKQFEIDFDNLSKLMLLYQEYIRSDFIRNKDLYRVEYVYYMFTSPIVEWAQIGGLAILWGEFYSDDNWMECVKKSSDFIFRKDGEHQTGLAETLIEYIQVRNQFMIGIAGRDILETGWQQSVANAISDSGICKAEYEMFGCHLKTNSKLLKAFCPNFMDLGFVIDTSEVFWVICANPFLNEDKRYHTRYSWEDKL